MMPDAFSPTYVTYLLSWTVSFLSLHGTQGLLVSLPTGMRVENFGAGVSNVSSLHVVISCFALRLKWA